MKRRRLPYFVINAVLGLMLLGCGLLLPAHWKAEDAGVLMTAGQGTPSLLERGRSMENDNHLGDAALVGRAAQLANIPGSIEFQTTVTNLARQNPQALFWGDDQSLAAIFQDQPAPSESLTDFLIQGNNRQAALARLQGSPVASVNELLRTRRLNNTLLLPASGSASGQAFDAAVDICGLLLNESRLKDRLSGQIFDFASQANSGGGSMPLERTLMDFLSLGQRYNWDQFTAFVAGIPDANTLDRLADQTRNAGGNIPMLFAAAQLSGNPAGVSDYVAKFPEYRLRRSRRQVANMEPEAWNGWWPAGNDIIVPISNGTWRRTIRLGRFTFLGRVWQSRNSPAAFALKWLLYLLAGFFLALALRFAMPPIEPALRVRGFHFARAFLFSVGFLLAVFLLSEPFLAQESREGEHFSLRLLPAQAGGGIPAGIAGIKQNVMNPIIVITMLVFFVLQALLYLSCLVKLAEIRRQNIPPRMKLKLLENEDHLFDAGLYLGFVGTIVSLIVASFHLVEFSLMAAYSSTSFGIIFVVIFKIFHLRPMRRQLLLEAEIQTMDEEKRAAVLAARLAPADAPTPALP